MRLRSACGLGVCVRKVTADEDWISLVYQWRIEVTLLVWYWRIPLWRCRPSRSYR